MKEMRRAARTAQFLIRFFGRNKAQSAIEYAFIIAVAVAGLLASQVYFKRGLQGRIRASADELGEQYAPRNTTGRTILSSNTRIQAVSNTLSERQLNRDLDGDGVIENDVFGTETNTTYLPGSRTSQSGNESVGALGDSLYE